MATNKLWKALNDAGYYTKSESDFNNQFVTPESQSKLYNALNGAGYYTKTPDDFRKQFFPPTKEKATQFIMSAGKPTSPQVKKQQLQEKQQIEDDGGNGYGFEYGLQNFFPREPVSFDPNINEFYIPPEPHIKENKPKQASIPIPTPLSGMMEMGMNVGKLAPEKPKPAPTIQEDYLFGGGVGEAPKKPIETLETEPLEAQGFRYNPLKGMDASRYFGTQPLEDAYQAKYKEVKQKIQPLEGKTEADKWLKYYSDSKDSRALYMLPNKIDRDIYTNQREIDELEDEIAGMSGRDWASIGFEGIVEEKQKELEKKQKEKQQLFLQRNKGINAQEVQLLERYKNGDLTDKEYKSELTKLKALKEDVFKPAEVKIKETFEQNKGDITELVKKEIVPKDATPQQALEIYANVLFDRLMDLSDEMGYDQTKTGVMRTITEDIPYAFQRLGDVFEGRSPREQQYDQIVNKLRDLAPVVYLNKLPKSKAKITEQVQDILAPAIKTFQPGFDVGSIQGEKARNIEQTLKELGIEGAIKPEIAERLKTEGDVTTFDEFKTTLGTSMGMMGHFALTGNVMNDVLSANKTWQALRALKEEGKIIDATSRAAKILNKTPSIGKVFGSALESGATYGATGALFGASKDEANIQSGIAGGLGGETATVLMDKLGGLFGKSSPKFVQLVFNTLGRAVGEMTEETMQELTQTIGDVDKSKSFWRNAYDIFSDSEKGKEYKKILAQKFPEASDVAKFLAFTAIMGGGMGLPSAINDVYTVANNFGATEADAKVAEQIVNQAQKDVSKATKEGVKEVAKENNIPMVQTGENTVEWDVQNIIQQPDGSTVTEVVPPPTIKEFADRLQTGEKMEAPEDLQFYENNKEAIESELKTRSEPTPASTPQVATEPPPPAEGVTPTVVESKAEPLPKAEKGGAVEAKGSFTGEEKADFRVIDTNEYIPSAIAKKAYDEYAKQHKGQSFETIRQRGGFAQGELDEYYPQWREEVAQWKEAKAKVETKSEVSLQPQEDVNQNPALSTVEATANALNDDLVQEIENKIGTLFPKSEETNTIVSKAYHQAKADGSNPELVKAVEDVLGKAPTQSTEAAGVSGSALKDVEGKKADIERRRQEELKQVKSLEQTPEQLIRNTKIAEQRLRDAEEIFSFGNTYSDALDNIMLKQKKLNEILRKREKEETKNRDFHQWEKEELEKQPEYQENKRLDKIIALINEVYTEGKSENFNNSTKEAVDYEQNELNNVSSKKYRNTEEIRKINAKYDAELAELEKQQPPQGKGEGDWSAEQQRIENDKTLSAEQKEKAKIESTAKALSEISKTEIDKNRSIKNAEKIDGTGSHIKNMSLSELNELARDMVKNEKEYQDKLSDAQGVYNLVVEKIDEISEAYHKAKADGSNPELVKAVEELLGTQQVATQPTENQQVSEDKERKQQNKEQDAIQVEKPAESVLRTEEVQPPQQVGLQGVEQENQPKVPAPKGAEKGGAGKVATPAELSGGDVESNWDYEGEGDAFASSKESREGKSSYVIRILDTIGRGNSYNRAKQRGELDTKSPLTYDGDKESISAIDGNGNTVGVIKLQTDGGIEHIVVAPEFSRKGVATELIKQIEQKGAKVIPEKSKLISPDAAKFFNKITPPNAASKEQVQGEVAPKVSASKKAAIQDLLPNYNLTEMEAGFLSNMPETVNEDDYDSGVKGAMFKKLVDKGYYEYDDNGNYTQSEKGRKFNTALQARQETRRGVKDGTDLFPQEAGIPEVGTGDVFDEYQATKAAVVVEADIDKTAEKAGVKPKNLRDLYNINRDLFGQNRVRSLASAIVMDRMVGVMANRAGISKEEMYGRLEFKKDTEENVLKNENALFQGTIDGKPVTLKNIDVDVVNGFYSPLEKIISESKQDKMPAKQWLDKFARGEEAKWTGLTDWLSQQQGSVSKADIQQFLKDNRISVVEVVLGNDDYRNLPEYKDADDKAMDASLKIQEAQQKYWDSNSDADFYALQDAKKELEKWSEVKRSIEKRKETKGVTKFSQYQLEGEKENYKEVLVTLPSKGNLKERWGVFDNKGKFVSSYNSEAKAKEKSESIGGTYKMASNVGEADPKVNFKSIHFDEPNILVHLRMNTRTDAGGNKILFLEEIQSDWGQTGKKEGFEQKNNYEIKESELYDGNYSVYKNGAKVQDGFTKEGARNYVTDKVSQESGISPGPFVTETPSWVKLGLKVALKEAVKQGADKIAWTTGEQQNDRYDLSKQVDAINYSKNSDGTYDVDVMAKGGGSAWRNKNATLKEVELTLGKDIADKFVKEEGVKGENEYKQFTIIEAEGLKVGGKGMVGFYGSPTEGGLGIVGNVAKSLFKQEVRATTVNTGDGNKPWYAIYNKLSGNSLGGGYTLKEAQDYIKGKEDVYEFRKVKGKGLDESPQPSIEVTPALRAEVERGLALFQREQGQQAKGAMVSADSGFIIYALTDPNVSTPIHELAHVFEHYLTDNERAIIKSWAKTKGWTIETSEKFARGFEKYLADGTAPTTALEKVFKKFKEWLTDIYNGITGSDIDLELNDDMKTLYAKMLGEEIKKTTPKVERMAKFAEGADMLASLLGAKKNITEQEAGIIKALTLMAEGLAEEFGYQGKRLLKELKKRVQELGYDETLVDTYADQIVPQEAPKGGGKPQKFKIRSVLRRAYTANEQELIGEAIKKHGMHYEVESEYMATEIANEIISDIGLSAAIDQVIDGKIDGAPAALIYGEAVDAVKQEISDALDSGAKDSEINELIERQTEILNVFAKKATDVGRFIKALEWVYKRYNFAYDLEKQIKDYEKITSKPIPDDIKQKFEEADAQIKELNKKIAELEKQKESKEAEEAFEEIRRSVRRKPQKPNKKYGKARMSQAMDNIAQVLGIKMSAVGDKRQGLIENLVELGLGMIEEGIATTKNVVKKIKQYVQTNIQGKIDFDDIEADLEATFETIEKEESEGGRVRISHQYLRDLVEGGIDNIDDLVKAVQKDFPILTEREVRDAITGYGRTLNPNMETIERKLRKMREIGRIISALEDVRSGKRPLKSGAQREKTDADIRLLRKQLREEMKNLPLDSETLDNQLKTSLDAAKSRVKNQIEELEKQISTKIKSQKVNKNVVPDDELKSLIETRDRLKEDYDDMFYDPQAEADAKIASVERALDRAINKLQEKITKGEIGFETNKPVTSPGIEVKRTQLAALKETLKDLRTQAGLYEQRRLDLAKRAVKRSTAKLLERIRTKDFATKKKAESPTDAELERLRAQRQQWRDVFDDAKYRAELKNRKAGEIIKDHLLEAPNLLRAIRATLDFSFIMVQGGRLTVSNLIKSPSTVARAFVNMAKDGFSAANAKRAEAELKQQSWYHEMKESGLRITEWDARMDAREEMFLSGYLNSIFDRLAWIIANATARPILGKQKAENFHKFLNKLNLAQILERGGSAYLNTLRLERYLEGRAMLLAEGKTMKSHPQDYKNMADVINTFTGAASLGWLEKSEGGYKWARLGLFSPRNWASQIKIGTPYALIHFGGMGSIPEGESTLSLAAKGKFKPSIAQKMAMADFARWVVGVGAFVMLAAARLNNDDDDETKVEFDPRSSDFLKIKIGDLRFDPWGGYIQQVIFLSRMLTREIKYGDDNIKKLGEGFTPTQWELVLQQATNKLSPAGQMLMKKWKTKIKREDGEIIEYDQFTGEYDMGTEFATNFKPIYLETWNEIRKDDPTLVENFALALASIGFGVNKYASKKQYWDIPKDTPEYEFLKRNDIQLPSLKKEIGDYKFTDKEYKDIQDYVQKELVAFLKEDIQERGELGVDYTLPRIDALVGKNKEQTQNLISKRVRLAYKKYLLDHYKEHIPQKVLDETVIK